MFINRKVTMIYKGGKIYAFVLIHLKNISEHLKPVRNTVEY